MKSPPKILLLPCFAGGKALGPPVLALAFPKLRKVAVLVKISACLLCCLFFPIILQQCFWQMEITSTKSQVHALAASLLKGFSQMFLPPVNWLPSLSHLQ